MFEETLFQKADDGTPFAELLKKQGIITGIKVDKVSTQLGSAPENSAGTHSRTNTGRESTVWH
jgi:fructose-bisphosphate aldolase class 1